MNRDKVIDDKVSLCCGAPVRIEDGEPDFIGESIAPNRAVSCWAVCSACDQPCGLVATDGQEA